MNPTVRYSHHLVGLVGRAEAAAARLADADPDRRRVVAAGARREAARLSVRLDGSPLDDATAERVDRGEVPAGVPAPATARTGWASALNLEGMATQDVAAVEYAGVLDAWDAEARLAGAWHDDPLAVLRELHGLLVGGLVDPDVAGRWRRTEQAVHDGAQGRIIHRAPLPEHLDGLMDGLAGWVIERSARVPAAVAAGTVHQRLLEWLPFEAANGRLARAAARLVRRARGLDPDAVAVPERGHAADALRYHAEVAATVRRRGDLGPWLERDVAALADALDHAVDAVSPWRGAARGEGCPSGPLSAGTRTGR